MSFINRSFGCTTRGCSHTNCSTSRLLRKYKCSSLFESNELCRSLKNRVGRSISTKSVGSDDREDITDVYKQQEKTREERDVMHKVLKKSDSIFARYYLNEKFGDIR